MSLQCKNQRMVSNQLGLSQLQSTKQCVRKQVDHFATPISEERKDPLGQLVPGTYLVPSLTTQKKI